MTKKFCIMMIFISLFASSFHAAGQKDKVEVRDFNTIRITGNSTETNDIDPEENKKILPYVLDDDRLDLLGGGTVILLNGENLLVDQHLIDNLEQSGFAPDVLVFYNNDTKEASTICVYQNDDLIYYSRTAYNFSPIQSIIQGPQSEKAPEFDIKDYTFNFIVNPVKEIDSNSAEYSAHFSIWYKWHRRESENFNDAEVRINGISLERLSRNNFSLVRNDTLALKVGDKITLSVSHEKLGELTGELTVPPVIDNLSVEPPLVMGEPNRNKTYLLTWDNPHSAASEIRAYRADERKQELDSYGQSIFESFHQWDPWELQEDGRRRRIGRVWSGSINIQSSLLLTKHNNSYTLGSGEFFAAESTVFQRTDCRYRF